MQVIPLTRRHHQEAAELLASAFFDYPMFTFYFPEVEHRKRNLAWYLGNVLNCTLNYGEAYTTPDLKGIMMLLPPGHTEISLIEYIKNGFFWTPYRLGLHNYSRSMRCENYVKKIHHEIMGDSLHYYLWGLAVDPDKSQCGIGKAMMQFLLDKADTEKLPIYLETHAEHNVGYYQQYGFIQAKKASVPVFDLPFWCMTRLVKTDSTLAGI